MEASGRLGNEFEALELESVSRATVFEDVAPALTELKAMGIELCLTSSLSHAAVAAFLDRLPHRDLFSAVWSRENARGIKEAPLRAAVSMPLMISIASRAGGARSAISTLGLPPVHAAACSL